MGAAIIIPARFASTRLPGKPLLKETGKYLIQHVHEQAMRCRRAASVLVATDDPRIRAAVESFGGQAAMTRRDHPSGTDRIAEAAASVEEDILVNLQGDEPLIDPADLDRLISLLEDDPGAGMATLAAPIRDEEQWRNPNCVKAVVAGETALYFSRSPVPFVRDGVPDFAARPARFLQHVGIYAYRREFLKRFAALPPSALERTEKLEQLRVLENGCRIKVATIARTTLGVDTREDYRRFVESCRAQGRRAA
ncbi:MAG: 3-deoxy-manno-octulosonate cytidylyltransferase [Gemmataceae bacterium]|nr:3-deoxy-manno-octulosonate cytidylyltransferase [Gemmataceae bacterium]